MLDKWARNAGNAGGVAGVVVVMVDAELLLLMRAAFVDLSWAFTALN